MNSRLGTGPLAQIIHPSQLAGQRLEIEIIATQGQCAAIQAALDIENIESFAAVLTVAPGKDGAVAVRGRVRATVTRACVMTLKNFDCRIDEKFDELYRPQPDTGAGGQVQMTIDIDDPDDAETFTGDQIDLGNLVFEILALALDPYPHGPDAPEVLASLDQLGVEELGANNVTAGSIDEAPERISPFAALLKKPPS